ncbi:MAG: hypothetical protein ABFS86_20925, partial [Planctomycetota bacterium]
MPNRNSKPLGAKEGCRFTFAVVTLSVVMLGLAIASSTMDEESVLLWFVLYAPLFAPTIYVKAGFGPIVVLLVLLGPVYHVLWSALVYRCWRGDRK